MKESRFVQRAFAETGNKSPVNVERDPQGEVSIADGYTPPYSNDPSAGGLYIQREPFNWILNYFTEQLKVLQINGLNALDNTILTTIGYPKGARCAVWLDIKTGQLNLNGENDPLCITIPVVSMKDNNMTNPYDSGALFSDWWIDDGFQIGEVKIMQVNLALPPSGYLDLAPNQASPSYLKETYPRIKAILGDSEASAWGFFKSISSTNFTILNPRGRFPRAFSNGSTIDSGRVFAEFQSDAIRNIKGGWDGELYRDGQTRYSWRFNKGEVSGGEWSQDYWGAFTKGRVASSIDLYPASVSFSPSYGWAFDASNVVPTTDPQNGENRPYNFNQKMYIKV